MGFFANLFKRRPPSPPTAAHTGPWLEVLTGPDPGTHFEITAARQRIGRDASAELRVRDPQSAFKVSRIHAHVWATNGAVLIEDNQSTHGVLINESRIADATPLHDGDQLSLGKVKLVYHAPSPEWWASPASTSGEEKSVRRATKVKPRAAPALRSETLPDKVRKTKLKRRRDS